MKKESLFRGKVFVISSPSGGGKTTVVTQLLKQIPDVVRCVTCTTRAPRGGEKEGIDYFFMEQEEFRRKIDEHYFFEWAEVYGNFYGTPRSFITGHIESGRHIICNIDVQGGISVQKALPDDSALIFLLPPSPRILEHRLRKRGEDSDQVIAKRLETAKWEVSFAPRYRYLVINDQLDEAVATCEYIIRNEIYNSPLAHHTIVEQYIQSWI